MRQITCQPRPTVDFTLPGPRHFPTPPINKYFRAAFDRNSKRAGKGSETIPWTSVGQIQYFCSLLVSSSWSVARCQKPDPFLPLPNCQQDFTATPLTLSDFSGSESTPGRYVGSGRMVYWKDCPSVTLARVGDDKGVQVTANSGEGRLAKGYVLIFIGAGGQYKGEE